MDTLKELSTQTKPYTGPQISGATLGLWGWTVCMHTDMKQNCVCAKKQKINRGIKTEHAKRQNIYSLDSLLGTPVQSNSIQYNSSAINSSFLEFIHFRFLLTLSKK